MGNMPSHAFPLRLAALDPPRYAFFIIYDDGIRQITTLALITCLMPAS